MDELSPPTLYDLLSPFLIDECELFSTNLIHFKSFWARPNGDCLWICDVYDDRVNVRKGGVFYATDPEFLNKLYNAIRYTMSVVP